MAGSVAAVARAASRKIRQPPQIALGGGGVTRSIHSGSVRECKHYDYEHRENMYEIWNMKNRMLKFGTAVWGIVVTGIALPVYIVRYQMKKAQG